MKTKLFNELTKHYGKKMVYAILNGTRKPSLEVVSKIEETMNIPAKAWLDIKSYIENSNSSKAELSSGKK